MAHLLLVKGDPEIRRRLIPALDVLRPLTAERVIMAAARGDERSIMGWVRTVATARELLAEVWHQPRRSFGRAVEVHLSRRRMVGDGRRRWCHRYPVGVGATMAAAA